MEPGTRVAGFLDGWMAGWQDKQMQDIMGSCACVEIIAAIAIRFVIGAGGGDEVSSAAQ